MTCLAFGHKILYVCVHTCCPSKCALLALGTFSRIRSALAARGSVQVVSAARHVGYTVVQLLGGLWHCFFGVLLLYKAVCRSV